MKKQFLMGALAMGAVMVGSLMQAEPARALDLTVNLTEFTGDNAGGTIKLTELVGGDIQFDVNITSPTINGDITGVFFDILNFASLTGVNITGSKVTSFATGGVCNLGGGNNLNGGGSPCPFDVGVTIGNPGGAGGLIASTQFLLSADQNLTLANFFNQDFGLRLQSTGANKGGSSKLSGVAPGSVAIPTPALLPGLVGMGLAAMRKKKQAAEVTQEA